MLRQPLLMLARSDKVKNFVTAMPVSSGIVSRYVPGESTADAVRATGGLVEDGLQVTLDFLGEDTLDREQADVTVAAYPLVPREQVGSRVQVTAANTDQEIEQLCSVLGELAARLELRSAA